MSSGFCNYLSSSLGSTLSNLGDVTSRLTSQIENSGLQNVAVNFERTLRENLGNRSNIQSQTSADRCYGASPGAAGPSSSSIATPDQENSPGSGNSTPSSMACDYCGAKFSFLSRKRHCHNCAKYFCSTCCPRITDGSNEVRRCNSCVILLKRPPVRSDLMQLRIKDLQRHLIAKKVNIKSCVEKKDLVELIIRQHEESSNGAGARSRSRGPIERQKSFPKNYTESTHRHEWLAKLEENTDENNPQPANEDLVEEFVIISSPSEGRDSPSEIDDDDDVVLPISTAGGEISTSSSSSPPLDNTEACNSISESSSPSDLAAGACKSPPITIPEPPKEEKHEKLSQMSSSAHSCSSPRKFANRGVVYLSEIETEADLNELSVKQMKDLLALNRVNYTGVTEKSELLTLLQRLWKAEKRLNEEKDNLDDSDLCKICLDNPVDCVMLECGHMCTCIKCGKQMNECPICRQYVVRVVKTFKS